MNDIVLRLLTMNENEASAMPSAVAQLCWEGADEISRLLGELNELRYDMRLLWCDLERLRAALDRIELAETDYTVSTDENMERVRSVARAALGRSGVPV